MGGEGEKAKLSKAILPPTPPSLKKRVYDIRMTYSKAKSKAIQQSNKQS